MNRKHNPWVALVALILMLVLIVCTCAGCETITSMTEETEPPRFIVERASADAPGHDQRVYIITDTATGVQYLFLYDYRAGGLTKLEPALEKEAEG